jgi:hypothetical protein
MIFVPPVTRVSEVLEANAQRKNLPLCFLTYCDIPS